MTIFRLVEIDEEATEAARKAPEEAGRKPAQPKTAPTIYDLSFVFAVQATFYLEVNLTEGEEALPVRRADIASMLLQTLQTEPGEDEIDLLPYIKGISIEDILDGDKRPIIPILK